MTAVQEWIRTIVESATAVGIVFNLWQVIVAKRAAINAANRASDAAVAVNVRAVAHTEAINAVAANVQKIELNTNSITERLQAAAFDAGSASGTAAEIARKKTEDT